MASPYLPDDCIYCILKYLQNYHSTLFNCLLVNRFWSKAAIPLLYASPFVDKNKHYLIILTLILCFSKTEILQLKNLIGINEINIDEDYKPLFEYPKYLKSYNYFIIDSTIYKWIESYSNTLSLNKNNNFVPMIHKLIISHSTNIEEFKIDLESPIIYNSNFNFHNLNLRKLKTLTFWLKSFGHEIKKEFLSNIENYCLNLKEFVISLPNLSRVFPKIHDVIVEKICKIIQKQNNLEVFTIFDYVSDNIFLSLEFQKHSLVTIGFVKINFWDISFNNFIINLYNLNYLIFENCKDTKSSLDRYEVLKFASFKLKKLVFYLNYWDKNIELTIIKYLGTSLQCLSILNTLTIPMIKIISIYCLNLTILEIMILGPLELLVFTYFKNLKIHMLNINIFLSDNEVFLNLATNLPINVKEISLLPFFSGVNQLYFKIFLENCHNYLEKINIGRPLISSEFFKLILDYIEKSNNSLVLLRLKEPKNVLDDEELKLLDEIKAKGVKIDFSTMLFHSYLPF
jgi:hypothetical protein